MGRPVASERTSRTASESAYTCLQRESALERMAAGESVGIRRKSVSDRSGMPRSTSLEFCV
jgi:hypothetical protein